MRATQLIQIRIYLHPEQYEWLNEMASMRDEAGQGRRPGLNQRSALLRDLIDKAMRRDLVADCIKSEIAYIEEQLTKQ